MPSLLRKTNWRRSILVVLIAVAFFFQVFVFYHVPDHNNDSIIDRMRGYHDQSLPMSSTSPVMTRDYVIQYTIPISRDQDQQQYSSQKATIKSTFNTTNGIQLVHLRAEQQDKNQLEIPHQSSIVHCVGDNFLPNAWFYRSCQYRNLCYRHDGSGGEFTLFMSKKQAELQSSWYVNDSMYYGRFATNMNATNMKVSSIGTTPMSVRKQRYSWSPNTNVDATQAASSSHQQYNHYELSDNVVWIPISFKAKPNTKSSSPIYLLMDTLLPVYNLISMFGWSTTSTEQTDQNSKSIVITILNHQRGSVGVNDDDEICDQSCMELAQELFSWVGAKVLVVDDEALLSSSTTNSVMICSKYGAAGIGMLTDHGLTSHHGQSTKDYASSNVRNVGRGSLLYQFRNYILQNLLIKEGRDGTVDETPEESTDSFTITIAISNSEGEAQGATTKSNIVNTLESKLQSISSSFHSSCCTVRTVPTSSGSLSVDSKAIVSDYVLSSKIWITIAGDASWPALFLPRGSTLIILYDETNKVKGGGKHNKRPAMYHFDLWNHLPYIKVHWLSFQTLPCSRGQASS